MNSIRPTDTGRASGSPALARLRSWVRHGLGLPGLTGAALLLATLAWLAQAWWVSTQQAAARPVRPAARPATADPGQTQAQALLAALPPAAQHTDDLARLLSWADAQGLAIARADSRPAEQDGLPLQRIDLQLQLTADYEATRRWLLAVLNNLPHAGLRSLRFERDDPDQPLATQLTLRLHYRADGNRAVAMRQVAGTGSAP